MNLIANDLDDRVEARQVALSDQNGPVLFELSNSNFGDHRVRLGTGRTSAFREDTRATITVPALRLDDVDGLELDRSTLLFMDVQGFEGQVLAGATRLLQTRPPVALELWPYGLDRVEGRPMLFDALTSYGRFFDINHSPPRPLRHRDLVAIAEAVQSHHPLGHTDILALA